MTNILNLQGLPTIKGDEPNGVMNSSYTYSACSSASTGC